MLCVLHFCFVLYNVWNFYSQNYRSGLNQFFFSSSLYLSRNPEYSGLLLPSISIIDLSRSHASTLIPSRWMDLSSGKREKKKNRDVETRTALVKRKM